MSKNDFFYKRCEKWIYHRFFSVTVAITSRCPIWASFITKSVYSFLSWHLIAIASFFRSNAIFMQMARMVLAMLHFAVIPSASLVRCNGVSLHSYSLLSSPNHINHWAGILLLMALFFTSY